jgi:bromodomain-containing factor 1
LKYCGKILQDLHRKQHYAIASPFYEPVGTLYRNASFNVNVLLELIDWQKMDLPNYPRVVRKPMDLSTMRKKLDNGEYDGPHDFYDDFKLMIRNCFNFNPTGTLVNDAGAELQRVFDEKWKNLPPLRAEDSEDDGDEVEDSEEDDRQSTLNVCHLAYTDFNLFFDLIGRIAQLENKKAEIEAEIEKLRNPPPPKEKKKKEKKEKAPVASTSKPPKQPKAQNKKKSKKSAADDDVLTFEQKKDLSEAIGKLDGSRLGRVIQIIHEGVPEIRDVSDHYPL